MEFKLDEKELETLKIWKEEHDKSCKFKDGADIGAIGGRLTFCFTGTSLGMISKVKCACGEEKTLTDFTDW